ncbi:MAG: hypothetical protein JRZ95_04570 [Nitrososphaerota archaeon]|jgi:hypothetical protein|nr:hypothetical protein [Nitrososphaerota archaeon]MCH8995804.1 hypothetical protein [Nitrososphaerota archaeon]MDG7054560.1 hypothetical protein [Nitrososphaerota archaeon]
MENNEHKKLVKGIIDHFGSRGLKIISASYDGFEKCEIIGNNEPDVIAKKLNEDNYYIGEAKTCENLTTERTRVQFEDFGNTVILKKGATRTYLPFCIAVPKKCIDDLKYYLTEIGLGMNENIETIGI